MIKTEFKTYMKEVSEEVGTEMLCDFCKNKIKFQDLQITIASCIQYFEKAERKGHVGNGIVQK